MAESSIITGQYVRIEHTPASVGERFLAFLIDWILLIIYSLSFYQLITTIHFNNNMELSIILWGWLLPVILYTPLCEIFNNGQSIGKRLVNIRVVKADGSTPGISAYLLRWLLRPIDLYFSGGIGVLVILLTNKRQRLGDLAANTMVITEKKYRNIQVSLDEFEYLSKNYRPTYPQASDLSLEQINVIARTLEANENVRQQHIPQLAQKVQSLLSITPQESSQEKFLRTIIRDYQYYALEEI